MRYFLDCEFWGFDDDEIISLALVSDRGDEFYIAFDQDELEREAKIVTLEDQRHWVKDNVLPIIDHPGGLRAPLRVGKCRADVNYLWPKHIETFLRSYPGTPNIVADWPDDIRYLCRLLLTGPGTMINIPGITFQVARVDAYPTSLPDCVQHNALSDARALRYKLTGMA